MRILVLLLLFGCTSPPIKTGYEVSYEQKIRKSVMNCVRTLRKDGFNERIIYPICRDMHHKKGMINYNEKKLQGFRSY